MARLNLGDATTPTFGVTKNTLSTGMVAANAAAVIGAMHGMKALPPAMVAQLPSWAR